jgi:hypothetical protein
MGASGWTRLLRGLLFRPCVGAGDVAAAKNLDAMNCGAKNLCPKNGGLQQRQN